MKKSLLAILLVLPLLSWAQEFNAQVQINLQSDVQMTDQRVLRELETSITRFFNDRQWTDHRFGVNEKIALNLQLTITEIPAIGTYKGTLILQAARPVYNTSYSTATFMFSDPEFDFRYNESQPLDFNENIFTENLPMMLGFYAYVVLGMDFDSFGPLGGTPYFEKARNVALLGEQSGFGGWEATAGSNANRNRAALIENIFNPRMEALRQASYAYHRLALDQFIEKPEEGRKLVLENLKRIGEVRDFNPSAILLSMFFKAKENELTSMFLQGDINVRRQAYELLVRIDPSNENNYRAIIQQR